jgi:pyrroline-5-carboxylate reductase
MQLGFIGTGEITSAIVTGLCSGDVSGRTLRLSPRNAVIARGLAERFRGVLVASSNQDVLDPSDTIVIAVRPAMAREVLAELRFRPDHRVISLVAALSVERLSELVAPAVQIARAVPLPSAARGLSPTAIYPSDGAALELFAAVGTVFPVEKESEFDAICATTATMAAYFEFNETIASWLAQQGVPAPQASEYIARIFLGLATSAAESRDVSFKALAAAHTTAGGLNEQFLKNLRDHDVRTTVSEGLDAILRRIRAGS